MIHSTRYAFRGPARLAHDAGISYAALNRLINGKCRPSYAHMVAITRALERHLHVPIDPREIVSFDDTFPTASVCELVGCRGCLPDEAYDENDNLRPEYRYMKAGEWSEKDSQPQSTTTNEPQ